MAIQGNLYTYRKQVGGGNRVLVVSPFPYKGGF